MKRILIVAGIIAAALALAGVLIFLHFRSQRPEALLARLATGKGNKEELIMRLNVARGDVIGPMIRAYQDTNAPAGFRADVLELLFKKHFHAGDPRIEKVILESIEDPDVNVRRRAAYGLAVYSGNELQVKLVDCLNDPDSQVRRQGYLVLGRYLWPGQDPETGLWQLLSSTQKDRMLKSCLAQVKAEQDEDMRLLARSVIGREIEARGREATRAFQSSDVAKAEKILRGALQLDPQNAQGQIRLVRFYLANGEKEKALELAADLNALIEVPQLSQAPKIDGDPSEAVWAEACKFDKFYHTTSRWVARPTEGKSAAYLGHLDGKIYISIIGYEDDLNRLVVTHTVRDSQVHMDDCVELVFDPGMTGKDYYQFIVNAAGVLYDLANWNKSKNFKCQYNAGIFPDRGYWAAEFAVAGKDLDNHIIEPGVIWSLCLFRVRIGPASEHGAIRPVFGWTHRMDLYPIAIFK